MPLRATFQYVINAIETSGELLWAGCTKGAGTAAGHASGFVDTSLLPTYRVATYNAFHVAVVSHSVYRRVDRAIRNKGAVFLIASIMGEETSIARET